jgi:uncharacterized tellurite resistance protein B-like protein
MSWLFPPSVQQRGPADAGAAPAQGKPTASAFDPFGPGPAPAQGSDPGAAPPFSLGAMGALIAAQEQSSGLSPMQQTVFSQLDTNSDGKITQSELETGFSAGNKTLADAVMGKLDTDGDGSISENEFAAKTKKSLHRYRAGAQGLEALLKATQSATSQGAPTSTDSSMTSGTTQAQTRSNLLQQLIRLQAQLTAPAAATTTATSA